MPSPDPIRLAIPKAYVLLTAGVERSPETALSIFKHLHTRLAPFKRIRKIELVTELPKIERGHILAPTKPGLGTALLPDVRTREGAVVRESRL